MAEAAGAAALIEIHPVESDGDVREFLGLRNEIDPREPLSAEAFAELRRRPRRLDVLALLEGEAVGIGSCGDHWVDPDGQLAFVNARVRASARRRGVGRAVLRRLADEARSHGRGGLYTVVAGDDRDSLACFRRLGWERVLEMQGVELELPRAPPRDISSQGLSHGPAPWSSDISSQELSLGPAPWTSDISPQGLSLVPLSEELDRAVYEVALEVEQDLLTAAPMAALEFDRWRKRQFRPLVRRDLSFAVLDGPLVAGYAILEESSPGVGEHAITGVRRAYRGRGLAAVLKQAQIRAATAAGLRRLRASNTVSNLPMRALNDRLGYRQTYRSVHLQGPLP